VSGLWHQLEAFWHGEWPFNQQVKDSNPLAWWESLQDHPHARVLAVSFAFVSITNIMSSQPAQAVAFEIHPDIDINSKALKDMVSTDPVSVVSTVDLSSVLESPQAAMMVTDDGDADWNY